MSEADPNPELLNEADEKGPSRLKRLFTKTSETEDGETSRKARKILLAGAAAVAMGAPVSYFQNKSADKAIKNSKNREASIIEYDRFGCTTVAALLRDGVKVRKTPENISKRAWVFASKDNVDFTIKKGQEGVVRMPRWYRDKARKPWLSMKYGEVRPDGATRRFISSPQIAEQTEWVDFDKYRNAKNSQGQPLIEMVGLGEAPGALPFKQGCKIPRVGENAGQTIITGNPNVAPVASLRIQPAGNFEENMNDGTYDGKAFGN